MMKRIHPVHKNTSAGAGRASTAAAGVILAVPAFFSARFFSAALTVSSPAAVRLILFCLITAAAAALWRKRHLLHVREAVVFGVFSLLFSAQLVLGSHIHIEDEYGGLMQQNYITEWSGQDPAAFLLMAAGTFVMSTALYLVLRNKTPRHVRSADKERSLQPVPVRWVLAAAGVLFVLWLPYLLVYWPGFVFGDSLNSIWQALGKMDLNNHHPLMYTMFIRLCLNISKWTGLGNTFACALYSIAQMIVMGLVLGYLAVWIRVRSGIRRVWTSLLIGLFGTTPYIAAYSIAMWKDPLFSAFELLLTLQLADLAASHGDCVRTRRGWLPCFVLTLILSIFVRNNGIYIAVFILAVLLLYVFIQKRQKKESKGHRRAAAAAAVVVAVSVVVTGPLYTSLGLQGEKVESVGIFLNQMARAAAMDGTMSAEDAAYMNKLLPLEKYKEIYRPCCTDLLKWDENFNAEPMKKHFFHHWFSMLKKNPGIYFESWMLQTNGFWAVGQHDAAMTGNNIARGVPINLNTSESNEYYRSMAKANGIHAKNLLHNQKLRDWFPADDWSIPAAAVVWGVLLLCACLLCARRSMLLALAPSIGLIITLLVSSPVRYWARYALLLQLLIPLYLYLFVYLCAPPVETAAEGRKTVRHRRSRRRVRLPQQRAARPRRR